MASFFGLPRELRDRIYEYCLLYDGVLDLNELRTGVERLVKGDYGLQPAVLRVCRQALDEGCQILYGRNTFYLDISTFREYYKPVELNGILKLVSKCQLSCLACQLYEKQQPFFLPPAVQPIKSYWNRRVHQVRTIQISLRPYTYCQWKQIQQTSFFINRIQCHHTLAYGLPPIEHLDILVIRVVKRSVFAETEISRPENWTSIGYKFQTTDSRSWRISSSKDTARDLKSLLHWSKSRAKVCIVGSPGHVPYSTTVLVGRQSKSLRDFLRTGILVWKALEPQKMKSKPPHSLTPVLRESITSSARRQGDLLVDPSGTILASSSIHSGSFTSTKMEDSLLRVAETCA